MSGHKQQMEKREQIETLLSGFEMILIGIGRELEQTESNADAVNQAYQRIAAFVKGKNYFVLTGNRDGKILDGTLYTPLTCAPNLDGQEKNWTSYMNWISCTPNHRLLVLELGEGFGQPQLMRWPFERVVMYNKKATLIRVGEKFSQVPKELGEQALSVPMDSFRFIEEVLR